MIDLDLLISEAETLLLPLFNKLRKEAIPVGIADYLVAIKTIKDRIGLEDSDRLQRFLCLLWVKSPEDQAIFNDGFEALVKPALEQILEETTQASSSEIPKNRATNSNNASQSSSSQGQEQKQGKNQQETKSISSRPSSSSSSSETGSIQLRFRQHYNLIPRLPITRREMTVILRNLRRLQREGVPEELDIQGTI
ncbi:hypothetical protein, partial [Moorena sp. SIO3I8]|uniref:hypothetical protein n=1 Tax=Moorena sp. SIO3I8 TaxID=2607833 RepID=UPI0013C0171D|nr:hypothetical protein [Moorena sp. SIO3I8]